MRRLLRHAAKSPGPIIGAIGYHQIASSKSWLAH